MTFFYTIFLINIKMKNSYLKYVLLYNNYKINFFYYYFKKYLKVKIFYINNILSLL